MATAKPDNIDSYISGFPKDIGKMLEEIRLAVKEAAPDAAETIKYDMPTFTLNGNLIHFAAFKNHIGMYPTPKGDEAFQKELAAYKGEKASARFPLDKPLPLKLITRLIKFRMKELVTRAEAKKR